MVDIHCHILPALDDGAKSLEESVAMINMAGATGTTDIVATPHANARYRFDAEQIARRIEELKTATNGAVGLHSGCDFHLDAENIQDALAHPTKYAINHRNYLLVEFSDFLIPPTTDEILSRLRAVGIVPIITHPERNPLLQERIQQVKTWVDEGSLVQVTAQSVLGRFGKAAQASTARLLDEGYVHFVASDGHDIVRRPPVLSNAYRHITQKYGEARAEALFVLNPRATLNGDPIEPFIPAPKLRKWYDLRKRFA